MSAIFQSTLPLRGVTRRRVQRAVGRVRISIHTPLAGSDDTRRSVGEIPVQISIHTPLAGSDGLYETEGDIILKFQSTLPLRGVTVVSRGLAGAVGISIHTPLAGSDE